jgi:hypothetical protein
MASRQFCSDSSAMIISRNMLALFLGEHDSFIFATCSSCDCPIVHYVTTVFPDAQVTSTSKALVIKRVIAGVEQVERTKHPKWVREFIARIDAYGAALRDKEGLAHPQPISGGKALMILENLSEFEEDGKTIRACA